MSEELNKGQREMFRKAVRGLAKEVKQREGQQESPMNKVLIAGEELRSWLESGWRWRGAEEDAEVVLSVSGDFRKELEKAYWRAYNGRLWWCPLWLMLLASVPIFVFWPIWWPVYWVGKWLFR